MHDRFLKAVQPLVLGTQSLAIRLLRGTTLGIRVVVADGEKVLLVRHTYIPGWYFPGGAVDPGETAERAAARELDEEAGLELTAPPSLVGVFFNARMANRDHVLVYRADGWRRAREFVPTREIAEAAFFPLDGLPETTTQATRARLDELFSGAPSSSLW